MLTIQVPTKKEMHSNVRVTERRTLNFGQIKVERVQVQSSKESGPEGRQGTLADLFEANKRGETG